MRKHLRRLMRSVEYLELAQKKTGLPRYKLGELLGIKAGSISNLMNGKRVMNDYVACRLAEVLGVDEMEIIAQCNLERAEREEERKFWKKKIQKLALSAVATVTIVLGGIGLNTKYTAEVESAGLLWASSFMLAIFLYRRIFA